ncbi:hypothetical protein [Rossellomorea sp. NS-SX7]|uniref:hypothetical protein n=1 Tax=Rossellomorea sp. NS-SX7 TaxID=3463856 RepID=UPI00405A134E
MKNCLSLAMICLLGILTGCNLFKNEQLPIELIAFNSLTREEEDKIPVSPKDSVVAKVTVSEQLGKQLGDKFTGKTIYTVTFNSTEDASNGRLVVYINKDKETVIGKGYEKKE